MIIIKTAQEIVLMRQGGHILAQILDRVKKATRSGISTWELNELAEDLIKQAGGEPSFKGFNNFPCALCSSINDALVHGVPKKDDIIKNGDIIGLDLGVKYRGYYTDMAVTVPVGQVSKTSKKMLNVGREALDIALAQVRPGNHIGDIGATVQEYVERQGFSVVRSLVGHGVGKEVHEPPKIPNFGVRGSGDEIKEGMTLALEPMICEKGHEVKTAPDGWTVITVDGGLAAHFEHTVVVIKGGREVLTR